MYCGERMKGDLALDTIINWIILLVVAGVVIGIIFYYSDEIKGSLSSLSEKENPETELFEAEYFSESQVNTYIELCWAKTGEKFNKDFMCYILKGDLSSITPSELEGEFDGYKVIADFNNSRKILVIRFEDIGNKIIVEN
jgi:hypothetical protein